MSQGWFSIYVMLKKISLFYFPPYILYPLQFLLIYYMSIFHNPVSFNVRLNSSHPFSPVLNLFSFFFTPFFTSPHPLTLILSLSPLPHFHTPILSLPSTFCSNFIHLTTGIPATLSPLCTLSFSLFLYYFLFFSFCLSFLLLTDLNSSRTSSS